MVVVALAITSAAQATLKMDGAKQRHWNWAKAAQAYVPLPDSRVWLIGMDCPLRGGGACVTGRWNEDDPIAMTRQGGRWMVMWLPTPGVDGWSYADERSLFFHELGHVADFRHLTRVERERFRAAIGSSCSWWSETCTIRRANDPLWSAKVPPGELFAEAYVACALNMSRQELEDTGVVTYGWQPPIGKTELCNLVRVIAA